MGDVALGRADGAVPRPLVAVDDDGRPGGDGREGHSAAGVRGALDRHGLAVRRSAVASAHGDDCRTSSAVRAWRAVGRSAVGSRERNVASVRPVTRSHATVRAAVRGDGDGLTAPEGDGVRVRSAN